MPLASLTEVSVLTSTADKNAIVPSLTNLAASTEMSSYGEEQWKFLLDGGDVDALVIPQPDDSQDLLGCVLRIRYGPNHMAFGMMLVRKDARGQGLAKKLLSAAMSSDGESGMKILGTCTELGRPMYEKMGFQRVSTVTKMSISRDRLPTSRGEMSSKVCIDDASLLPQVLDLDRRATGLDRSKTLKALFEYPYVQMATLRGKDGTLAAATMVTQHTGSFMASVGPILGDEACVLELLQGIRDAQPSSSATDLSLIVSDHPSLVETLKSAGFQTIFELGAMTMDAVPLPGDRNRYLGLIHPTLG